MTSFNKYKSIIKYNVLVIYIYNILLYYNILLNLIDLEMLKIYLYENWKFANMKFSKLY